MQIVIGAVNSIFNTQQLSADEGEFRANDECFLLNKLSKILMRL